MNPQKISRFLRRLTKLDGQARVIQAWSQLESYSSCWNIPEVQARWNTRISGDPAIDFRHYFYQNYLDQRRGLRGLSLGCGKGTKTLQWAALGVFDELDAFDLSPARIERARELASQSTMGHVVSFQVCNVQAPHLDSINGYDLVICESSLHHFSDLEHLLPKIEGWLKPGGFFIADEFVGPSRFQWTDRQLEAVNGLLAVFPNRLKGYLGTGTTKREVFRPSILRMVLNDPSEAVESSRIVPGLERYFKIIERKPYGGTILHPLLHNIAHNFLNANEEALALLQICFDVEDALLESGELSDDFEVFICGTKDSDAG